MNNDFKKIKADIYGIRIALFILSCKTYIGNLLNNTNFVLDPTPAAAAAKLSELESAQGRMNSGDRTAKPERNSAMNWLKATIGAWVTQINGQANGDTTKLETTGMPFVKERTPRPAPKKVSRITAKNGLQSGIGLLSWTGDKNADYFRLETSEDGNIWHQQAIVTSNRHQVDGLTTGNQYKFRVCGGNHAGLGAYSEIATLMVA
ncbi:MAG: fibronectin type III domain-containing protein [Flavobacteriales bacterium]